MASGGLDARVRLENANAISSDGRLGRKRYNAVFLQGGPHAAAARTAGRAALRAGRFVTRFVTVLLAAARLRLLQGPRRAALPRKTPGTCAVRHLPRREHDAAAASASARRRQLDRGAEPPEFRGRLEAGGAWQPGRQPAIATPAVAKRRRRRVSRRRQALDLEGRCGVADAGGMGERREAHGHVERAPRPASCRPTRPATTST